MAIKKITHATRLAQYGWGGEMVCCLCKGRSNWNSTLYHLFKFVKERVFHCALFVLFFILLLLLLFLLFLFLLPELGVEQTKVKAWETGPELGQLFFFPPGHEITILQNFCKSSPITVICPSNITFTTWEPRKDIFLLVARIIFAKDTRSVFVHAQCLDTVPLTWTGDPLSRSPYCTTIVDQLPKGEGCFWSVFGA